MDGAGGALALVAPPAARRCVGPVPRRRSPGTIRAMTRTPIFALLVWLAFAAALAGLALRVGLQPAAAATRTYVHSFINEPASPLRVRPSTIRVQGSGGISYAGLHWRSWGGATALAKGRQCSARAGGCAGAVSVRLSDVRLLGGRRVYTCLRPLVRGEIKMCLPTAFR